MAHQTVTTVRLHIVTWNVADQGPPEGTTNLGELLGQTNNDDSGTPDIIVVGFQEVAGPVDWTKSLNQALSKEEYVLVKSKQLSGMIVFMFSLAVHMPYIRNIESASTRCGYGGLFGNKGAVSIRAEIYGVDTIFINSHLDAHDEKYKERIAQYSRIIEKQQFKDEDSRSILDHDYVFWMGDLNFRINDIPREKVIAQVEDNTYTSLLAHDQLKKAVKDELVFLQFHEGDVNFPPTYKFDPNTDIYDTSEKQRKPAWCDRILWLVHQDAYCKMDQEYEKMYNTQCDINASIIVEQHKYTSLPDYKFSDHKPVISYFTARAFPVAPAVEFEPLPTGWIAKKENLARYTMEPGIKTSKWDWIGLYKVGFNTVLDDYSAWVRPKDAGKISPMTCKFKKHRMKVSDGLYRLLYVNEKGDVLGMSDQFRVTTLVGAADAYSSDSPSSISSSEEEDFYSSMDESDSPRCSSDERPPVVTQVAEIDHPASAMPASGALSSLSHGVSKMASGFVRRKSSMLRSPVNPELRKEEPELTQEEDLKNSMVKEDMSIEEIRGILPKLYQSTRRSDPSVLQRKASNLSARLSVKSSHTSKSFSMKDASTKTVSEPAQPTKTNRKQHTDL